MKKFRITMNVSLHVVIVHVAQRERAERRRLQQALGTQSAHLIKLKYMRGSESNC